MVVIDFYTRRLLGPKDIAARAEYQPQSVVADWPLVDDRNDPDEIVFDHKRMDDIFGPETKPRDNSADHDVAEYAEWMAVSHLNKYNEVETTRFPIRKTAAFERAVGSNQELVRSANELRAAAQRLRDLAGELRATRTRLQQGDKSQYHNQP